MFLLSLQNLLRNLICDQCLNCFIINMCSAFSSSNDMKKLHEIISISSFLVLLNGAGMSKVLYGYNILLCGPTLEWFSLGLLTLTQNQVGRGQTPLCL